MKMKALVVSLALVLGSVMGALGLTSGAFAAGVTCPPGSLNTSANTLAECNVKQDDSLMPTAMKIINVIVGVIGVVAVLVIVIGAVLLVVSQGDPGKVARARLAIIYAVVGLVIALLAFAIVNFVLTGIFGGTTATGGAGGSDV